MTPRYSTGEEVRVGDIVQYGRFLSARVKGVSGKASRWPEVSLAATNGAGRVHVLGPRQVAAMRLIARTVS